ncbi:hypothetical protein [Paludifilum halophilum]|nr:hypothetical protein [Paludifilum halophilum]
MNESLKPTMIQTVLGTVIAVNLMLGGILIAREQIVMPEATPALGQPSAQTRTEYRMELEGTDRKGNWRVEHYRKIKVQLDEKGRLVEKKPTSEQIHLRYWEGE